MPTTILQQMLVQGREVEAEMDVRAMREQVASRDMRRGGDAGAREGEDEDDAFQDADARLDGPANDFSPRSSVKKKKKFQTKPDTKSGFEISKATLKGSDAPPAVKKKKKKSALRDEKKTRSKTVSSSTSAAPKPARRPAPRASRGSRRRPRPRRITRARLDRDGRVSAGARGLGEGLGDD